MDSKITDSMASRLIETGIALTNIHNIDELLEFIVEEARGLTNADGGSLYIVDGTKLDFSVCQNNTLTKKVGPDAERRLFTPFTIPITGDSIAGFAALKNKTLNFSDVYNLPDDVPFIFNRGFDQRIGYRTKSMLTVPMSSPNKFVVGVLQLINAFDEKGCVIPFPDETVVIIQALASQAAVALKNAKLTSQLELANLDTIFRLAVAAEFRDEDTAHHIERISEYSAIIAHNIGLDDDNVKLIKSASPMHDVGKIGVPDSILRKPGKLTPEETEIMKKHTLFGAKILGGSSAKILQMSEIISLTHHEKWDGSGYPKGLKGDEIPIESRIVAIADVFDALSNARCYKPAFPMDKVLSIIKEDTGTHFDPRLSRVFFDSLNEILETFNRLKESSS